MVTRELARQAVLRSLRSQLRESGTCLPLSPALRPSTKRYGSSPGLYTCDFWAFLWGFLLLYDMLETEGNTFVFR